MTDLNYIKKRIIDYCKDNHVNMLISSEKYFDRPCRLGIDEAGRGPVLGPMVYAGAYIEIDNVHKLNNIGLDDSKKLKEQVRTDLLETLSNYENKICGYEIEIISPNVISTEMLNTVKNNLNIISHDAAIGIIKRVIAKGVNLTEVYIDTVGPPEKYKALVESHFPGLTVVVEKKADSLFPIVSAASIFAKVTRDQCIEHWQHRERLQETVARGSGYPADPDTKKYLQTMLDPVFGFPQMVRASWSTANTIVEKECVPVAWEDGEEGGEAVARPGKRRRESTVPHDRDSLSLLTFYSPEVCLERRTRFFASRGLLRVVAFK